MLDDIPNGEGVLKFSETEEYKGTWIQGLAHGRGHLKTNMIEYDGLFRDGLFDGIGTLKIKGKGTYTGKFAEGKFCGKGKFTWDKEHKIYVGSWRHGFMHGKGLMIWSDGRKFYGEYQKGLKHGKGVCIYPSGENFKGTWYKGTLANKHED